MTAPADVASVAADTRITVRFAEPLLLTDFARALKAIDDFEAITALLRGYSFISRLDFYNLPRRREVRHALTTGEAIPRTGHVYIVRARIASPGFVTLDGSDALGKLIDVLHKGGLEREQLRALIEHLKAETALINAQVVEKHVATLTNAVSLLQTLGVSPEGIRAWLLQSPWLVGAFGGPIEDLQELIGSGAVTAIEIGGPDAEPEAPAA